MSLPELLRRCAEGDEALQSALLDEAEPLLFGYFRSLLPTGDESFDRAVALTHAAALGFLLDLRGGRVRIQDAAGLRSACHRIALAVLRNADPALLAAQGDPETGSLAPTAIPLAREWESVLPEPLRAAAAARLQGVRADAWDEVATALEGNGLLRADVPKRDA